MGGTRPHPAPRGEVGGCTRPWWVRPPHLGSGTWFGGQRAAPSCSAGQCPRAADCLGIFPVPCGLGPAGSGPGGALARQPPSPSEHTRLQVWAAPDRSASGLGRPVPTCGERTPSWGGQAGGSLSLPAAPATGGRTTTLSPASLAQEQVTRRCSHGAQQAPCCCCWGQHCPGSVPSHPDAAPQLSTALGPQATGTTHPRLLLKVGLEAARTPRPGPTVCSAWPSEAHLPPSQDRPPRSWGRHHTHPNITLTVASHIIGQRDRAQTCPRWPVPPSSGCVPPASCCPLGYSPSHHQGRPGTHPAAMQLERAGWAGQHRAQVRDPQSGMQSPPLPVPLTT